MEQEIRSLNIEFKAVPDSRIIEGRAIPFNIKSPNREGFKEMVLPSAVEGVLEKSDIFMLYNHKRDQFLARNKMGKGSLSIEVRDDGVYFSFEAGNDNLSNYILDRIQRGDLNEMSWAFTIAEGGDIWTKGADGVYERTISQFDQIYDFSIVDQSYYGIENAVGCKRFAEVIAAEREENERKLAELKEQEEQKIKDYYTQLKEENKKYLS